MEILTSGINRECNDAQGGVLKLYLFGWEKYNRSQIEVDNNVLLSFPYNEVAEIGFIGNVDFTEEQQEDDGGEFYSISLSFKVKNTSEVFKYTKRNLRAVVLDRNGNYRLLGTYNGLFIDRLNKDTGLSMSDFNGFEVQLSGKELRESPFFYDLGIINNADYEVLLQENGDYLLQENGFKIKL